MKGLQVVPPVETFTTQDFIQKVKDATYEEIKNKAEKEDETILELLNSKSFKKFKELVEKRIEFLRQMINPDTKQSLVSLNDTPETIGVRFLIIDFAINQLRQMINLPEIINEARRTGEQIRRDDQRI